MTTGDAVDVTVCLSSRTSRQASLQDFEFHSLRKFRLWDATPLNASTEIRKLIAVSVSYGLAVAVSPQVRSLLSKVKKMTNLQNELIAFKTSDVLSQAVDKNNINEVFTDLHTRRIHYFDPSVR